MIYVDRDEIPKPEFWDGPEFRSFLDEWAHFHGVEGGTRGTQKRAVSGPGEGLEHFRRLALPVLLDGFHRKCAYTEEQIDEKSGTVVLHRPEADAVGLGSDVSPEHYWWLVGDWSNWYPASREVASVKGTRFPVVGKRSPVPPGGELPSQEWIAENRDRGLLLDPCRHHPAWFLEFRDDGHVRAREHPSPGVRGRYEGHSPGAITISILNLNADHLVEMRKSKLQELYRMPQLDEDSFNPGLLLRFNIENPFSSLVRQVIARRMLRSSSLDAIDHNELRGCISFLSNEFASQIVQDGMPREVADSLPRTYWNPLYQDFAREWPELYDEQVAALISGRRIDRGIEAETAVPLDEATEEDLDEEAISGSEPPGDEALSIADRPRRPRSTVSDAASEVESGIVVERTARVEHLEVRNFKAIEELSLTIPAEPVSLPAPYEPWGTGSGVGEIPTAARWVAFLGENGSGKSTCLEALGLALAGDELDTLMEKAAQEWSKLLRRGARQGRVLVRFTGGTEIDLRFTANTHWWIGADGKKPPQPPEMAAYVRGYGATRLLQGGPQGHGDEAEDPVRLENLFNPYGEVLDAETWLLSLDEGAFNVAAITLAGFLEDRDRRPMTGMTSTGSPFMTRKDGEVLVEGEPLFYLSDGYRAVITLVCDVMAGLGAGFSDLRNATGMVLIDELGAHLHPRWRMEITTRLRREFPQVQFFVSTHEPLCLRGMFGGEVIRVYKKAPPGDVETPFPPGVVKTEVIERSPSDYRVDQLLTSEFFGLATTIDPDLDRRFQAYYRLLAMDPDERAEAGLDGKLEELRRAVDERTEPVLGFTRRDQLVYEAIDGFLAEQNALSDAERRERRRKTLEKVQDIWRGRRILGDRGAGRGGGG